MSKEEENQAADFMLLLHIGEVITMGGILIYNNRLELSKKMTPLLAAEGMDLLVAQNHEELEEKLQDRSLTLLLLDIELADKGWDKGIQMIGQLRKDTNIPLIVISGQTAETAKIMALEAGADDYVTEDCNPLVLLARIKSQLRRYYQLAGIAQKKTESVFRVGNLIINDDQRTVDVEGRNVRLTPIEYRILRLLVQQQGKVLSNSEIYEKIWNMQYLGTDNTIAVHIRHIREKIEDNPRNPKYLKVVWGTGYTVSYA